jgi:hypothetical protein
VPAGARAVHLRIQCYNSTEAHEFNLLANATTKSENRIETKIPIGNTSHQQHGILALDPDGLVDYYRGSGIAEIVIFVLGWFL